MKTKIRIPKRGWALIHLALLVWIAWISSDMIDGAISESIAAFDNDTRSKHETGLIATAIQMPVDYNYIVKRNIFNSAQTLEDQQDYITAEQGPDKSVEAPKTSLGVELIGTALGIKGGFRYAVIEETKSGEQGLYGLNDDILGARIVRIDRNTVLLEHDGQIERLDVDYEAVGKSGMASSNARGSFRRGEVVSRIGEGEYAVSRKYVEGQLSNINSLLTKARAVPFMDKSGATVGFKLFSVKKGSAFDKIGLKNHDVVKRINGVELNSVENGLELFQALRNESTFEVDILRNSAKKTLRFNIQ